jgi:hypothetical protein
LIGIICQVLACDCAVTIIDTAHVLPWVYLIGVHTLID